MFEDLLLSLASVGGQQPEARALLLVQGTWGLGYLGFRD